MPTEPEFYSQFAYNNNTLADIQRKVDGHSADLAILKGPNYVVTFIFQLVDGIDVIVTKNFVTAGVAPKIGADIWLEYTSSGIHYKVSGEVSKTAYAMAQDRPEETALLVRLINVTEQPGTKADWFSNLD